MWLSLIPLKLWEHILKLGVDSFYVVQIGEAILQEPVSSVSSEYTLHSLSV